ncbi:MAG: acetolactate synthase large subunit [Chloroflexi bacterium]|nr:acetolactate synthase large subunit [Chloroflexota bacterium]
MKVADLLVRCLEAEGVEYVFGLPGEEILEILHSLSHSKRIKFITTRHEQSAAFMADVYGRLTGRPGVCLATLGPGATNLLTGIADAYLDRAPLVAITGQAGLDRVHKESHQYIDVLGMFQPVVKWNARLEHPLTVTEVVRKAFKVAQTEKPGPTHIEVPEDVAKMEIEGEPLPPQPIHYPGPNEESIQRAATVLQEALSPLILVGNGVIRGNASQELTALAEALHVPVAHTFMAKGCIDYQNHLSFMTVGLQSQDWVMAGLAKADVVVAAGYDMVEYAPSKWNSEGKKRIIHIDTMPAEVDAHYQPEVEIVGDIGEALAALRHSCKVRRPMEGHVALRETILSELSLFAQDTTLPMKPQKVLADLRRALRPQDIVVSDVGAHKLWVARMFPAHQPNTVIISNGFASMGIGLPGAIAAKLVYPERRVVVVVGDGGFLMNCQEMETARRLGVPLVVVVWVDGAYGVVEWNQKRHYGETFGVSFSNPDFVRLAQAFDFEAYKPQTATDFLPLLQHCLESQGPCLIEVPIDYGQNQWLTERLGSIIQPL